MSQRMPDFDPWTIVSVPFPYTGGTVLQRRPALVIAGDETAGAPHLLWVLMITSAANRGWPGDVLLTELEETGLPSPSVVRTMKIATVEADHARRIGTIAAPDKVCVDDAVRNRLARFAGGDRRR